MQINGPTQTVIVVLVAMMMVVQPAAAVTDLDTDPGQPQAIDDVAAPQVENNSTGTDTNNSTVTTSDTYISWTSLSREVDNDDDGHISNFNIRVSADTNLDTPITRTTDPYFVVTVDGTEVLREDVEIKQDIWDLTIDQSNLEDAGLDRGEVTVTVEVRNTQFGSDPVYDDESITINYEPDSEDLTVRDRGLIGVESLQYERFSDSLSSDYWQNKQAGSVEDAFEALFPTVPEDRTEAQFEAAKTILDEQVTGGLAGDLMTIPEVVTSVSSSLEEGKIANTLIKTSDSTEHNFHQSLDQLQSNTETIRSTSDPSDETLENRLNLIEKTYERSVKYESEMENTYTDNQEFFPDLIIWLYGADEDSYNTVKGFFDQLQKNLIADYYYTQLAKNPNQSPKPLTDTADSDTPTYPSANVVEFSTADTVQTGEEVTVSLTVQTKNADTPSQTVALAFPDNDKISDVSIAGNSINDPQYAKVFDSGSELWTKYGEEQQNIQYPVVETAGQMSEGETNTLEVTFTPEDSGDVRVWAKSIAWADNEQGSLSPDPGWADDGSTGVVRDGQDELAYEETIAVEDPDPASFDVEITETNSPVNTGDTLDVTGRITNTGELSGTQRVELDIPGVGSDSAEITLDPGKSATRDFNVQTADGDDGEHTASVSSDDDSTNKDVRINKPAAFSIESVNTNSPIEAGEDVTFETKIKNTGDVSDQQEVSVSIPGVGSDSTSVSLDPGESKTINSLSVSTDSSDDGAHTATVSTADSESETDVRIQDPASFAIEITDTNAPLEAGEELKVTADIENTGDVEATNTLTVDLPRVGSEETDVTLSGGAQTTETIRIDTSGGDDGSKTVTASIDGNSDNRSVEITDQPEEATFAVNITETNSPVTAGDALSFAVDVENLGDLSGTTDLTVDVPGVGSNTTSLTLEGGEQMTETLKIETSESAIGTYTATASTRDRSAEADVRITEQPDEPFFDVTIDEQKSDTTAARDDDLSVVATIENTGDTEATETIELRDFNNQTVNDTSLTLTGGESQTVTLSWPLNESAADSGTVHFASETDSETLAVTIESTGGNGIITGVVSDLDGNTLSDVSVTLLTKSDTNSTEVANTSTDGDGEYKFTDVRTNQEYLIQAAYNNTTSSVEATDLQDGQIVSADVVLDTAPDDGRFNVTIDESRSNTTVESNETLSVTATIENVGDAADTTDVKLLDFNNQTTNETSITVAPGESQTTVLQWSVSETIESSGTLHVVTDDDRDSLSINVSGADDPPLGERTIENDTLEPGESTIVTASVDSVIDPFLSEAFSPAFAAVEIVADDDAVVSGAVDLNDEVVARWEDREYPTLVYEVTVPENATPGDKYEIRSTSISDVDFGNDTITVVEPTEPAEPTIEWTDAPPETVERGDTITMTVSGSVAHPSELSLFVGENEQADRITTADVNSTWNTTTWELTIGEDIPAEPGSELTARAIVNETNSTATNETEATISVRDTATNANPSVELVMPTDEMHVGDTVTVPIVVTNATRGVSGYNLSLVSANGSVVQFADYSLENNPGFLDSSISDDATAANLAAGMGDNEFESSDSVTIATVTLEGIGEGTTTVAVTQQNVTDSDVRNYDLGAADNSTINVAHDQPPKGPQPVVGDRPPQDLDGDGLYEDVRGNGEVTIFDVQALFSGLDDASVQNNSKYYDFAASDEDTVTVFDVQALFSQT